MRGFGILILVLGAIGIMLALNMDTSVTNSAGAKVTDLGLMADRQLYILGAAAVIIAGTLMAALSGIRKRLALTDTATRPCPVCGKTINITAVKCTHCAADVAPLERK